MNQVIEAIARILRSPAFRLALIGFMILLLMIPLFMVSALIAERSMRADRVRAEVAQAWGPEQTLNGPFLIVPYSVRFERQQDNKTVEVIEERRAVFTPDALAIAVQSQNKTLRRSIFDVPVYNATLKLTGRFAAPDIAAVAPNAIAVRWKDANVVLALSGVAGLKEASALKIPGATGVNFAPSLDLPGQVSNGIHARLAGAGPTVMPSQDAAPQAFDFEIGLTLNGSMALEFAPAARETRVSIASNWPHPGFSGAFLPDERSVSPAGFQAVWKIPHLARSVPESWSTNEARLERLTPYSFGVRLVSPVDFYAEINRAVKYAIMFLTLTFMSVFCLELVARKRVHAVQYIFTGIALVFFFVLLLSLAEHIGFTPAYTTAASATSLMLAAYIGAVFKDRRRGLMMLGILALSYLVLYFILQLEDYALLAGALVGFAALTAVMFATLRIDWSGRSLATAVNR